MRRRRPPGWAKNDAVVSRFDPDALRPRAVAASSDELLAAASERGPLDHNDGKSGARMERVVIDGEPYVAKWLDARTDWTMRAVGDLGCKTLQLWQAGLLDALPDCISQPIVAVAVEPEATFGGYGTVLLMHDVGAYLVPEGDDPIPEAQHRSFIEHMAAMHARFWDFDDRWLLTPVVNRFFETSPWVADTELALGWTDVPVPRLIGEGWRRFPALAPEIADLVLALAHDPTPLATAVEATPLTLVHGNWKLGNLGTDAAGRTVLFDWESPGPGPACGELAWYLALNCARLPVSKEATIDCYRGALEAHGIDTEPWWDRQLALSLLGILVMFGWEKALGGRNAEMEWWLAHAEAGRRALAAAI